METWLVTGGAGFIGCNFVRMALARRPVRIAVVDKLTYAGNRASLGDVAPHPNFVFVHGDIADRDTVTGAFRDFRPSAVVNFAAESHVDRSIDGPRDFIESNTLGVFELLEASRGLLAESESARRSEFRFLHVSTDEVFGSLGSDGTFSETTPYDPSSPYSATKAAGDHLVRAWHRTFDVPTLLTNCSNNYGPYQYPEKLIPLTLLNALEGRDLPIYGDGLNVRDWLYVEDHCAGILEVLERGRAGESYNIGGENERTNVEIVDRLCSLLEELRPARDNEALRKRGIAAYADLKRFVADRPGHDRRYAVDARKVRAELGWTPRHDFASGLRRTVEWYLENREWCAEVQAGAYRRERLGLGARAS